MSQPSRSVTVAIKNNEYTVNYPKTGDLLNIELMKIALSDGKYDQLKYSFTPALVKQSVIVDAIATFSYVIPKLKEDLNTKSMLELTVEQMEEVLAAYLDQFLPWFEEWNTFLANPPKKEDAPATN